MKTDTFSKWIIRSAIIQGFMMMWASYLLAAFGRTQIAEDLSKVVCVEIVGIVIGYYTKSTFENVSKNNNWPDKNSDHGCNQKGAYKDAI